jgi:hypothetical protein
MMEFPVTCPPNSSKLEYDSTKGEAPTDGVVPETVRVIAEAHWWLHLSSGEITKPVCKYLRALEKLALGLDL